MALKDPDAYKAYMRKYMLDRYVQRRTEALLILGNKCVKCGSTVDLEFDHIDPSTKIKIIGHIWSYSKTKFWAEIKKCQLLCKICHQAKSLVDLNFNDAKNSHCSNSTYITYKCRCNLCRQAHNKYCREYKRKRKLKGL